MTAGEQGQQWQRRSTARGSSDALAAWVGPGPGYRECWTVVSAQSLGRRSVCGRLRATRDVGVRGAVGCPANQRDPEGNVVEGAGAQIGAARHDSGPLSEQLTRIGKLLICENNASMGVSPLLFDEITGPTFPFSRPSLVVVAA